MRLCGSLGRTRERSGAALLIVKSKTPRVISPAPHMIKGRSLVIRERLSLAVAQTLAREPVYAELEVLDLWSNKLSVKANAIGPAGAEALARSPVLARLEQLDLHSNKFGPAGVLALITSPMLPRATRGGVIKVLQYVDSTFTCTASSPTARTRRYRG